MQLDDKTLTLSDAARSLPPIDGKRPHASTIWRWCREGVLARNGQRVCLHHVRMGRRILTSASALAKFSRELAEADAEYFAPRTRRGAKTPRPRSDAKRRKAIDRADAELVTAGI